MPEVNFEVKPESLAVIKNTVIEANFEEVRTALTEMMEPYKTLVVTEDGIANAKSDRARIRKVAGGIDDMRKAVKKAYTEPLTAFETKCKELVGICESGSANLDEQIKAFEKREADEKIAKIKSHYDFAPYAREKEYCPWESVFNPKWANKGYSVDDAKGEIAAALLKTKEDVEAIRSMGGADTPYLLDFYKQTHDLGAVIRKAKDLKAQREAEERREAELEVKKGEAKEKAAVESAWKREIECEFVPGEEPTQEVAFVVWATKRQLMSLKGFLRANGIKYGRVRDE